MWCLNDSFQEKCRTIGNVTIPRGWIVSLRNKPIGDGFWDQYLVWTSGAGEQKQEKPIQTLDELLRHLKKVNPGASNKQLRRAWRDFEKAHANSKLGISGEFSYPQEMKKGIAPVFFVFA